MSELTTQPMIDVRVFGGLRWAQRVRLIALPPRERASILRKVGREIAMRLKREIRKTVRASAKQFPDAAERAKAARRFSRMVVWKATPDQVVVYDRGLEHERLLQDQATPAQARRMRELGFRLSKVYIQRHFSRGLAGMIIRELEKGVTRGKRKNRGSLILMVWRHKYDDILRHVDVPGMIRRELALR